jgi:hypothetical protein
MATTLTWLGTTSGAWQSDDNWSGGQQPSGGDNAVVALDDPGDPPFTPVLANATLSGFTLTLENGNVLFDTVMMGGPASGFSLVSMPNPANLGGGSNLTVQGTVTLGSLSTATISNILDLEGTTSTATFENDGAMTMSGKGSVLESDTPLTFDNNGTVAIEGLGAQQQASSAITGTGTIQVNGDEGVVFYNSVANTQTIDFQHSVGVITLAEFDTAIGGMGTFSGALINMVAGDDIRIDAVSGVSVTSYDGSTLLLSSSAGPISIRASGDITGFQVTNGSGAASVVALSCFAAGTHIATTRGEVPVETLVVGDSVVTHAGDVRPIVWKGIAIRIACGIRIRRRYCLSPSRQTRSAMLYRRARYICRPTMPFMWAMR